MKSSACGGGIQVRSACSKALWVHDQARPHCNSCTAKFTFLRRRHHCRVCGEVVCRKCTRTVYLVNTSSNVGFACIECAIPLASPRATDDLDEPHSSWCMRPTCPTFLCTLERQSLEQLPPETPECALCIRELQGPWRVLQLPCHHAFHDACLLPWLKTHDACPTCTYQLPRDTTATATSLFT
ncbi:hypothetical protein SDRG_12274 [Saprolegnia diclina VS20]|uniref:RING-type domain-containing protein n=1 Tax=Saprolegnia diclina (strain VS20) TaxID=1156394 RepID=T0PWX3_SAPDV|nr:hypothetical protein SDRG_12274 [Saprolegnia diclina VS20]EQC29994.1 hypothetical protein SDRG_12274 [Saprolegnia diclina VS20]|eukprot:XP_008616561.1 hypothetical protein SDRG_12274 [Saprolegnia diclina VS20]